MNHLQNAIHKSKLRYSNAPDGQWYAYLIPMEILALLKAGLAKDAGNGWDHRQIERAHDIAEGTSHPNWFYFHPRKELREMLFKEHPFKPTR